MIKRVKRVRLDEQMIDDIWHFWQRFNDSRQSRTSTIDRVAQVIGCSHATVYRVVSACEQASAGKVVRYDRLNYPNHMMVNYINEKFASSDSSSSKVDTTEDTSVEMSDTALLAKSISELAAAMREQNELIKALVIRK